MNRILRFDDELGLIQIELGVTQIDIEDYLQRNNADFILNVTGSSEFSSVVGNALERGIAHYGSRETEVKNLIKIQIECLKNFLHECAKIFVIYDADLKKTTDPVLLSRKGTLGHAFGKPCGDALLSLSYNLQEVLDCKLEASNIGTLFIVPALPFKGKDFALVSDCVTKIFRQYNFDAYMTFNLFAQTSLEGVINLTFLRSNPDVVATAHLCINKTLATLEGLGYPPLRLSIFQKSAFLYKNKELKTLRNELKKLFDPDNIIARVRYEPN